MEYKWYDKLVDSEEITQGDILFNCIVDFNNIYTIPKNLAKEIAKQNKIRLRLCPPYREHLSQSFARFFMRVGLPINIKIY